MEELIKVYISLKVLLVPARTAAAVLAAGALLRGVGAGIDWTGPACPLCLSGVPQVTLPRYHRAAGLQEEPSTAAHAGAVGRETIGLA